MRHDRVGGIAMHTRVSFDPVPDDRRPVILVHGLGMSSRYMIPLAEHLAPHLRVCALDLPGFGLSDKPSGGACLIATRIEYVCSYLAHALDDMAARGEITVT